MRTGYGCVDSDGRRHRLVLCGAIRAGATGAFPDRLATIYRELCAASFVDCQPECVAIENLFHADQRAQRAQARARPRRRDARRGRSGRPGRRIHARRRSSARWSAMAARRKRRCSR